MLRPLPPADPVGIAGCALGAGPVKILASLMGATRRELLAQIPGCNASRAVDVIEWRADALARPGEAAMLAALRLIRAALGKPLLWTLRTRAEGGGADVTDAQYCGLARAAAASGLVDAVDCEIRREGAAGVIAAAHAAGLPVVASFHDFEGTPAPEAIDAELARMRAAGADVLKFAVMPRSPEDALAVMSACLRCRRAGRQPVIAIAMGEAGAVTRVEGAFFGSCASFAALKAASAPGQLDADRLRAIHDMLPGAPLL
ncbi:MAG: type I 3-dehydroquinate dehydratase [Duodenibacillus sp.]|nr:type I 3-dehydroquinate dehydratase [Duodenibacillus sp.]